VVLKVLEVSAAICDKITDTNAGEVGGKTGILIRYAPRGGIYG